MITTIVLSLVIIASAVYLLRRRFSRRRTSPGSNLKVIQFGNGKFGLLQKGVIDWCYAKDLTRWGLDHSSAIEHWCQFDTIEEVEAIQTRLELISSIKEV